VPGSLLNRHTAWFSARRPRAGMRSSGCDPTKRGPEHHGHGEQQPLMVLSMAQT
jgi:hypothetical protein